jgi:hypothetical protein
MATEASRQSSSRRRSVRAPSRRGWIVLALAVAAGAAAVVVATNGFSFGKAPTARARVSKYIDQVDLVQKQMGIEIGKVVHAYRAYVKHSSSPATLAELMRAESTFRNLQKRIASVPAPPEAAKLARLLSSLLGRESDVAVQVARLAEFTPAFHTVAVQTQLLSAELSRALAAVPQPKPHQIRGTKGQIAKAQAHFAKAAAAASLKQAEAVDLYDQAVGRLLVRLRTIVPPRAMAPAYRAQIASLQATSAAGAALAASLRAAKRSNIAVLSRKFALAARTAGSVSSQREEIAAVKDYDARVRRIGTLELAVQKEAARLSGSLT